MLHNEQEIKQWIQEACDKNNQSWLAKHIKFEFSGRLTNCMGIAYYKNQYIKLSKPLWERATPEQRRETVIHEACHLIAPFKHGLDARGHGREWKDCMVTAGLAPSRCHTVDRRGIRKEYVKYEVKCDCTKLYIGHVKAAKIKKNLFQCSKCNSTVTLTGNKLYPGKQK